MDPCVDLVRQGRTRTRWNPLQKCLAVPLRRTFLHADTPQDRIERAVHRELSDLSRRTLAGLDALASFNGLARAVHEARAALRRGESEGTFPREDLERIARWAREESGGGALAWELDLWIGKHRAFERRLRWLMDPEVTRAELNSLDPVEDADQLWCFVKYDFRPEFLWSAWGNGVERIAQSEAASTFFHATGKAEGIPTKRGEDTLVHYSYLFNWGLDGYHGRKAVESMNRIHGRYFIPNDGMKYVLLNAAFTVLDALDAIGHRPLADTERRGYFHATIGMGHAMRIQELTHSWDEMRAWFDSLNAALAGYAPQKRRMWSSIEDNFDREQRVPWVASQIRRLLEVVAMDDTYRSALGFETPTRTKVAAARAIVRIATATRALLPKEPYIESLQNWLTYPDGVDIDDAGERKRSERMPSPCPFASPALRDRLEPKLPPFRHVREAPEVELRTITWDEVRRHRAKTDLWVVFGGHVYDVTPFAGNHPGGLAILLNGPARDMTTAFEKAGHSDLTKIFMLNFRIGRIESSNPPPTRH